LVVSRKGVDQKRNEGDNIYNSKIIRSSSAGKLESSLFVLDKEIKVSRDKIKNNGLKKTGNLRRKARSRSREKQNQLNPQKISKVQFSPGNKRKVVDLESEKKEEKELDDLDFTKYSIKIEDEENMDSDSESYELTSLVSKPSVGIQFEKKENFRREFVGYKGRTRSIHQWRGR